MRNTPLAFITCTTRCVEFGSAHASSPGGTTATIVPSMRPKLAVRSLPNIDAHGAAFTSASGATSAPHRSASRRLGAPRCHRMRPPHQRRDHLHIFTRLFSGSYSGFSDAIAGNRRPAISTSHVPPFDPRRIDHAAARRAVDHREPDRAAERVAVRRRADVADRLAVAAHDLGVEQQRLRILHEHLHEPLRCSGPAAFCATHRVLAEEAAGFFRSTAKPRPASSTRVGVVDVVAVVAIALLHPAARERLEARVHEADLLAGLDEPIVDVQRLLGRDVELVAELAEVGDAHAQHAREADVDLARRAERERLVRHVGGRHELHQLARARALHVELRVAAGHVGDERVRVRRIARFIHVSTWRCAVSDATTQNRSSSSLVTVRSACSLPASSSHCVYVICPAAPSTWFAEIQSSSAPGVAALHEELRHERHVHHDHALARRAVLGRPVREPVWRAPRQLHRRASRPAPAYQSAPSQPLTSRKYAPRAASRS